MTLQAKGRRNDTLEVRESLIQSRAEGTAANHTPTREEIRLRAYEIYLERGPLAVNELDDWLQAKRELERAASPKGNGFSSKRAIE
jgi:hypothetical protein